MELGRVTRLFSLSFLLFLFLFFLVAVDIDISRATWLPKMEKLKNQKSILIGSNVLEVRSFRYP